MLMALRKLVMGTQFFFAPNAKYQFYLLSVTQLCSSVLCIVSGTQDHTPPRVTLAEVAISFLCKIQPAVYIRIANFVFPLSGRWL